MNPKTIELILSLLEAAGTLAVMVPTLGAKWRQNRDEVLKMVEEDRDPTPEEHARLTRELVGLEDDLAAALASAQAGAGETEGD